MRCPGCGAEVNEQAVYCHKCGQRIDLADQRFPSDDRAEAEPTPEDKPSGEGPGEAAAGPALTPTEKFKDTAMARQGGEDEPEEELWQGAYSSKAMIRAWALGGLITIVLLAIWIKWFLSYWVITWGAVLLLWLGLFLILKYRQMRVRYRLTTQRFIHETGILRRVTDRIEVIDMDDITFEQSVLERVVGVGTIRITSSDRTHPELLLLGIENVNEVAEKIDDIRRSERRRRGLHIESI